MPRRALSPLSASFNTAAQWTSRQCGSASTFAVACVLILVWAVTGPIFQVSDTWQLVINTGTTIVTFLMVFLIQNTQNRDSAGLHLKLDELIRVNQAARNKLLDLEDLTEGELEHLKGGFTRLAGKTPGAALLREATDDLDAADAEIREARDKVSAVADSRAVKPDASRRPAQGLETSALEQLFPNKRIARAVGAQLPSPC